MVRRMSWTGYCMNIAELVARRSTCLRRNVGAIAVKDRRILATGYNGAPSNYPHCLDKGCLREQLNIPSGERHELCNAVHAEQNVIIQAATHGISLEGSVIYCTHFPCFICAKMLINCGVSKIIYKSGYPDDNSNKMFKEMGIPCLHYLPDGTIV